MVLIHLLIQRIETDESAKRPEVVELLADEIEQSHKLMEEFVAKKRNKPLGDSTFMLYYTSYCNQVIVLVNLSA